MPSHSAALHPSRIRPATPADAPTILRFIRELAEYEHALHEVKATEADLLRDGWGLDSNGNPLPKAAPSRFEALIAEWNGAPVGFALYFRSYSTWLGHHGIRLEDIYVTPSARGQGIGKALLAHVAHVAVVEGCPRLEWDVLTWNAPAIAVYERVGARTQEEWRIMRVSGDALHELASLSQADMLKK